MLTARFQDGHVADIRDVICRVEGLGASARLVIADRHSGETIETWPVAEVFPVHARPEELRIGAAGKPTGARLSVRGTAEQQLARQMLPALAERHRQDRGRQLRMMGITTVALASVVFAYVFGVPLIAGNIVRVMPPEWEQQFGDRVAQQLETALLEEGGWEVCDPNPNSVANRAISRFAEAAMDGAGSPFEPEVTVIRSQVPNAFALPGGKAFYFSALLDQTQSPDEFAGVMAHELGHVAHRHVMENLVSSAGTGLLIGFILGDMTGLSIAGGLGSALIDSRFSREAERQADRFAASVATRMSFQPSALATLLERISADDQFTRAMALLSTHPLTAERRAALEALPVNGTGTRPPFTAEEWAAIRSMCDRSPTTVTPIAGPSVTLPRDDKLGDKSTSR